MRATVNSTKPQTTSFVEQDTALCLFRFVIVNYDASSLMCVDCIVYYYHVAKWKESPAIPGFILIRIASMDNQSTHGWPSLLFLSNNSNRKRHKKMLSFCSWTHRSSRLVNPRCCCSFYRCHVGVSKQIIVVASSTMPSSLKYCRSNMLPFLIDVPFDDHSDQYQRNNFCLPPVILLQHCRLKLDNHCDVGSLLVS